MTGSLASVAVWVGISLTGAAPAASWSKVTPEAEREALRLFEQGNVALAESSNEEAVEAYEQALRQWDHPAIHYNMAMALMNLKRSFEAHEHLEAAIRYGPGPLNDPEKYAKAKSLMTKLEPDLARIEITCDEPEVKVTVDDGAGLFTCPGTYGAWVRSGKHTVQATKVGVSRPTEHQFVLGKGQKAEIHVKVYRDDEWFESRTLLPAWSPWVAIGTGVATTAVGGYLHLQSWGQFRQFDAGIIACVSPGPGGSSPCVPAQELTARLEQGRAMQSAAHVLYAGTVVAVATGILLFHYNPSRSVPINPVAAPRITVMPRLEPGFSGAMLAFDF